MPKALMILLVPFFTNVCKSQSLDTTYEFYPSVIEKFSSVKSLKDSTFGIYKIQFQADSLAENVLYATLKYKNDSIYYKGIYKNELVYVEIKDNKGIVTAKGRYKLKEVEPKTQIVISLNTGNSREELTGYIEYFQRDGYWETYKNGKSTSIYYSKGKKLKMKD